MTLIEQAYRTRIIGETIIVERAVPYYVFFGMWRKVRWDLYHEPMPFTWKERYEVAVKWMNNMETYKPYGGRWNANVFAQRGEYAKESGVEKPKHYGVHK